MLNPFLTRETALEAIQEDPQEVILSPRIAPTKSFQLKLEFGDSVVGDSIFLIRKTVAELMDVAAQQGFLTMDATDNSSQRFRKAITSLEKHWNRSLVSLIDDVVIPPKLPLEDASVHFVHCQSLKEVIMNGIEHSGSLMIEGHSSSKGIAWIIEQKTNGKKFIERVNPIVTAWPPESLDFRYKNQFGQQKGNGLTQLFSPRCLDQFSYEFIPPNGLRIIIMKYFIGNPAHDVEFLT